MTACTCRTERLCLAALLAAWLFALAYDAVLRWVQRDYGGGVE
jgi:hypothetical protein